jgi:DNA helicase-2/ATP-dependent DNA helicase PcrA
MIELKLDKTRHDILISEGHAIIEGGPGSGKTTIAMLKAKNIIENGKLLKNQKVLFLSFARATISRIEEQAKNIISSEVRSYIEINTYHGFAWQLIQSYGYLVHGHKSAKLITPPNLAARLATVDPSERDNEKLEILTKEGLICFDLFCQIAATLLGKSARIAKLISMAYPYLIVDEFQDTDSHEWSLIKTLGSSSKIIAMADLQQRIYEFRGASITRIPEFIAHFSCNRFDLGKDNNRSDGTDIAIFGDDLLTGDNRGKQYKNVKIVKYGFIKEKRDYLKYELFTCINRLKKKKAEGDWSIAILVKTKAMTLNISSYLLNNNISHEVLIDPVGPALAASVIAFMMEPIQQDYFRMLSGHLINHIKGRKGDKPTQTDISIATFIEKVLVGGRVKGIQQKLLIQEMENLIRLREKIVFQGIPEADWLQIRRLFENCKHSALKNVYEDARYLKLLHKGAVLSERLTNIWRSNTSYFAAKQAVDEALTMEHFSMVHRLWRGIYVMNIHKAKGKEFDEVIIWEEPYKPIVFMETKQQDILTLRVAVTRARLFTTFLTPQSSPSIIL